MRSLAIIGIIGIILLIIGLSQIASKTQTKLVGERIVEDVVKFTNQDVTILAFNASKSTYNLKIEIKPIEKEFGGIVIKPLIYAILVDKEGLRAFLNNQTISHIYLKVEGLEDQETFTINNLSGFNEFYILFSTPLPEQSAEITITMIYPKINEPISIFDIGLVIGGISMITIYFLRYKIIN
ncbi:MAG: hypothetical protein KatS3mg003_1914 [Candidatus Nitrosocaldaceae archaeon]|nr:MAG: hypothetical protein KatS3mg003_1914 [Candidatus Nitrosocaldaceae archaeon]